MSFSVLVSSGFTLGTKHLDSCSTFHTAVVTSRAFPSHFVSCFYVLDPRGPGPYTQCGIGVPSKKAAVRWSCFPGLSALLPMRRALSGRKSWTFSFMLPYTREMMIVDNSLDCVVSQRPHCGTLGRLPRPLSLMFPYSRRVMIVLRRSMYSVGSDGLAFGLFVPLPRQV